LDELTGRLDLVRLEIEQLQEGIRSHERTMFQIKGWAVTVGLAAAGAALTAQEPFMAILGIAALVAFLIVESHRLVVLRKAVVRCREIERVLTSRSLAEALGPGTELLVPLIAHSRGSTSGSQRWIQLLRSCFHPYVFPVYVGLIGLLALVALIS
jgi:uncharacterized membrane protein